MHFASLHIYLLLTPDLIYADSELFNWYSRRNPLIQIYKMPPDTDSGASMRSNGNKGVGNAPFFNSHIYTFFIRAIPAALHSD